MSRIPTSLVTDSHAYTRSREPWRMEEEHSAFGVTSSGHYFGWRLFRYLSSGGMKSLGRGIREEERASAQRRFLVVMLVLFAVYAVAWMI